ncbi:hypothetical protein MNBD_ALPHA12-1052 [hydrothermal vent metagenome]|uniref:Uncharacterized protein n=1 Tax=hydrothermal vent metagenome TaxID=652676 RepID=A0A3B0UM01_9ZZZZ
MQKMEYNFCAAPANRVRICPHEMAPELPIRAQYEQTGFARQFTGTAYPWSVFFEKWIPLVRLDKRDKTKTQELGVLIQQKRILFWIKTV